MTLGDWVVHVFIGQLTSDKGLLSQLPESKMVSNLWGREQWEQDLRSELSKLPAKQVEFHNVTLENFKDLLTNLSEEERESSLVLNLCDGTEDDGFPGLAVVRHLVELGIPYTGADPTFYSISTDKILMKRCFDRHNVAHSPWVGPIEDTQQCREALDALTYPLICKPAMCYGSCGVTKEGLVWNAGECVKIAMKMQREGFTTVYAEQFIPGREFTCFVHGDEEYGVDAGDVIEPVFDVACDKYDKCLYFGDDGPHMPTATVLVNDSKIVPLVQEIAKQAHLSVKGNGYSRVDIRWDQDSDEVKVLEVNANPGLGGTFFSLALQGSGLTYAQYVAKFLSYASARRLPNKRRKVLDLCAE